MHTMPYTEKPPQDDDLPPQAAAPDKAPERLPMRKEAPNIPSYEPPPKEMSKTFGGKVTDFFIYKVLGFGANSAASVGITYWINPNPKVKQTAVMIKSKKRIQPPKYDLIITHGRS